MRSEVFALLPLFWFPKMVSLDRSSRARKMVVPRFSACLCDQQGVQFQDAFGFTVILQGESCAEKSCLFDGLGFLVVD